MQSIIELINESLKKIKVPGSQIDLFTSQRVKNIDITETNITISIVLQPEETKFQQAIADNIRFTVGKVSAISQTIKVVFENPQKMASEGGISGVKNLVAIASGKGGVGKSTITANLAISLAQKGLKVGLIDADIFGPSVPKMFGVENQIPNFTEINGKQIIIPIEKYGIKILSIGFFVKKEDSLAWRGPMASGALKQLINDALWGELDILLFDTPPGTSDIHLTILQTLPLTGAVIVTTPQDVAIIDAVRGIDLFKKENINVPILGLVENMSWFTPAELPDNKYFIFGKGGGERLAKEYSLELLGQVPIIQKIREGGDEGEPVSMQENTVLQNIFSSITDNCLQALNKRNATLPQTEQIKIKY